MALACLTPLSRVIRCIILVPLARMTRLMGLFMLKTLGRSTSLRLTDSIIRTVWSPTLQVTVLRRRFRSQTRAQVPILPHSGRSGVDRGLPKVCSRSATRNRTDRSGPLVPP